jgi:glycosyltransferase involved in cell wall biosynthesis/VanZ family protein
MNVLILSEPGENGVFTFVEALCHFLIERGVTVHLGYSDRRGSDRLEALVAHVESRGGLTANMEVGSGAGPADLRAFLRVWRLAERVRPDVVHCHSSKAGVIGRSLALAGLRSSFVYQPHAYYGMSPERRPGDGAYRAMEAAFGRIGTTIVVSEGERRFATERLGIPARRLKFIANGVDVDRFTPADAAEKQALRQRFGIPRHALVLGAMSRLSSQKDPLTLYRAFAAACEGRPDLHLFHVGSGELGPEVRRAVAGLGIGGRVARLGYLSDPTGFYKAVDGFILTSTYEGLSLASLEAISSNLPVILSRAPGNADLLDLPLSHAWGADPGDAEGFARAIGLWHASRLLRPAPNHRAVALERFDGRNAQAEVLAHYHSVARGGASAVAAWSARLPAAIWIGLIACESTDKFSRANTRRLLYPPFHLLTGVSSDDFYGWNFFIRKAGHVLLYGTLGALLYRLARHELPGPRPRAWSLPCAAMALAGTALVAALDEWHQTTIPSRTGTVADVLLDTAAGLAALALIACLSAALLARPPAARAARRSQPTRPTRSARPETEGEATGSPAKN